MRDDAWVSLTEARSYLRNMFSIDEIKELIADRELNGLIFNGNSGRVRRISLDTLRQRIDAQAFEVWARPRKMIRDRRA